MEVKPFTLIVASIGWILLLTVAVITTTTSVNSRIDALAFNMNTKFDAVDAKIERRFEVVDRKIDTLQNLIVQHLLQHPEAQDAVLANQPVEELNPTG